MQVDHNDKGTHNRDSSNAHEETGLKLSNQLTDPPDRPTTLITGWRWFMISKCRVAIPTLAFHYPARQHILDIGGIPRKP